MGEQCLQYSTFHVDWKKLLPKNLSAFVAPEYVVSGPNQGDFTFRFQLNAMFPPSK
ncbi:MAG: hypothetical protein IPF54_05265 [Draconibacterium sp.]|nr:hypothetical protein [Draconibacterium sp.]